jgi:hypothetical protein
MAFARRQQPSYRRTAKLFGLVICSGVCPGAHNQQAPAAVAVEKMFDYRTGFAVETAALERVFDSGLGVAKAVEARPQAASSRKHQGEVAGRAGVGKADLHEFPRTAKWAGFWAL